MTSNFFYKNKWPARFLKPNESRSGCGIVNQSGTFDIDFTTNDYLGLSQDRRIANAVVEAIDVLGWGSTGSRWLSGDYTVWHTLTAALREWWCVADVLIMNSGYAVNSGVLPAIMDRNDVVLMDKNCHASWIDGARLSRASWYRFRHNDCGDLERRLRGLHKLYQSIWIVTESVFSMDGDLAPIVELVDIGRRYGARLIVDEAHAVGVFGSLGQGLTMGLPIDLRVGTFGKAMGSIGAFIGGDRSLINRLVDRCRTAIYTTALPPVTMAANLVALDICQSAHQQRTDLQSLMAVCKSILSNSAIESPIIPIYGKNEAEVCDMGIQIRSRGGWINPIYPPTVPAPQLRLSLSAAMPIDRVTDCLSGINCNG